MNPLQTSMNGAQAWVRMNLLADKKKAALLAVLLLTAAGLLGQAMFKSSPKSAAAAPTPAPTARLDTRQTVSQATEARVRRNDDRREEYLAKIDRTVTRDLFAVSYPAFPPTEAAAAAMAEPEGPSVRSWLEQLQAQAAADAEAMAQKQQQTSLIRGQAQALRLQSLMMTSRPTAMINGQILTAGEMIGGFRVERIAPGSCVVSQDGVEVTLKLE